MTLHNECPLTDGPYCVDSWSRFSISVSSGRYPVCRPRTQSEQKPGQWTQPEDSLQKPGPNSNANVNTVFVKCRCNPVYL